MEPRFPDYILGSGRGAGLSPYMPTYNYGRADRNHIKSLRSSVWSRSCGAPPHTICWNFFDTGASVHHSGGIFHPIPTKRCVSD